MRNLLLSGILLGVLFLSSCKKNSDDTGNAGNSLMGNYKFVSLTATTTAIRTINEGGTNEKTITTSTYTTTKNTGTLTIEASNMVSNDLSYSVSTLAHAEFYEDGILYDTEDLPLAADVPSSSATMPYKVISSDSLYFPAGALISFDASTQASKPGGAKYIVAGDKLLLSGSGVQYSTMTQSGYVINSEDRVIYTATYQKQ